MTRIKKTNGSGAVPSRPKKQNYLKSGKLAARREQRRDEAEARNAASTPESQQATRAAYHRRVK